MSPLRQRLHLEKAEIELFERLAPLAARSPRALKRMSNLYRLIRVRIPEADLASFLAQSGTDSMPSHRARKELFNGSDAALTQWRNWAV
jgi:hypothetical protein